MKKVKFVGVESNYSHFKYGKIFDVIRYIPDDREFWDSVAIMIDNEEHEHYLYDGDDVPVFIDATTEYRSEVIDDILS